MTRRCRRPRQTMPSPTRIKNVESAPCACLAFFFRVTFVPRLQCPIGAYVHRVTIGRQIAAKRNAAEQNKTSARNLRRLDFWFGAGTYSLFYYAPAPCTFLRAGFSHFASPTRERGALLQTCRPSNCLARDVAVPRPTIIGACFATTTTTQQVICSRERLFGEGGSHFFR